MKNWGCACAMAVALVFALSFIGLMAPLEATFFLAAGWLFFLWNVLPQLRVSWPDVATAIVALAVFIAGFHRLTTWWSAATPVIADAPVPYGLWKWSWTLIRRPQSSCPSAPGLPSSERRIRSSGWPRPISLSPKTVGRTFVVA